MRQNFLSSTFGVRKIMKSYFFKNNWRSPPTFVFLHLLMPRFWNFNFVTFCQNYFWKNAPLEYSSSIIHLSINPDAKYLKCKDKGNCALIFSRCNKRVWLFTKLWCVKLAPLMAAARGGAWPAAQQHLCFQSLQGWGGPSFPHSSNSAQFLEAFCVVPHIAKKCHHHNIINITNLGNNFQYSMDRKVEVKNVFVMSTLTSWCL